MARSKPVSEKAKGPEFTPDGMLVREIDDKAANGTFDTFAQRQLMYENFDADEVANAVYMRSGCLPFDLITGGRGLPRGRFMLLYSEPGVGKSTLLFSAARGLCNNGLKVLYLDAESSDDTAEQMGLIGQKLRVPEGSFKYLTIGSYNELEKVTDAFTASSFDVCMLDSISAIGMSKAMRKKSGKTLEEATAIGLDARLQTLFMKNFYSDVKVGNQSFIYIAQTRNKIDFKNPQNNGSFAGGSNASKFFSNLQVKMNGSSFIKQGVRTVGRYAYLVGEKNRHAAPMIRIPAAVYFGKGIDNIDMLLRLGNMLGIFRTTGAWSVVQIPGQEPVKVQGKTGLEKWIKENYEGMVQVFYENAPALLDYFGNGEKVVGPDSSLAGFSPEQHDAGFEVDPDEEDDGEDALLSGEDIDEAFGDSPEADESEGGVLDLG